MKTQRLTFSIEDLSCGGGGSLQVEQVLARLPGVVHAFVNPSTEMAYVEYDQEQVDGEYFVNNLERAGFRAEASLPVCARQIALILALHGLVSLVGMPGCEQFNPFHGGWFKHLRRDRTSIRYL